MVKHKPFAILATNWEIKTQRPIHLKDFYSRMQEWLVDHEYSIPSDADFPEISYYQSETQKGGKEIWVKWRCNYIPQDNKFYRRLLYIDIHTLGMKPIEVMQNNKKFKMEIGDVYISCQAFLEIDWEGKWRKHWLLKHFLPIYYKRIAHHRIERYKEDVYHDAWEMNIFLKEFLEFVKEKKDTKTYWPKLDIRGQQ